MLPKNPKSTIAFFETQRIRGHGEKRREEKKFNDGELSLQ
jgi:hypothetical protein